MKLAIVEFVECNKFVGCNEFAGRKEVMAKDLILR
jgi:hypothetical protein